MEDCRVVEQRNDVIEGRIEVIRGGVIVARAALRDGGLHHREAGRFSFLLDPLHSLDRSTVHATTARAASCAMKYSQSFDGRRNKSHENERERKTEQACADFAHDHFLAI
jgi:hypothetical protein